MLAARVKAAIVLVVMLASARGAAEPTRSCPDTTVPCHLHMREETTVTKDNGQEFRFPPGHFLNDPTYSVLDDELRRLQDSETRLKAENQSLRGAIAGWQPGWLTTVVVFIGGAALGVGGYYYVTHH
jgi:hypothetical protein